MGGPVYSGEGAVLGHYSAAALFGFVPWDERYPEVTVTSSATRRHRQLLVHRAAVLSAPDISSHRGIPTTSPARTLADLGASLDYHSLRRAVRQAQSLRRVQLRELVEVVGRLGRRRGVHNLTRILASGPAPTRSEVEDVVLDLILNAGLERPEINMPLRINGRWVVPDFRWPEARLVVEADGAAWHDSKLSREDDAERQALLEAQGERGLRVTWRQAVATPSKRWPVSARRVPPANLPPRMVSTNQFKNGTHIEVDGTVFRIVDFQHVKPGKGGAFVRTKLKRVGDGAVIDRTFRAGEKFRPVRTESRKMTFLYTDGTEAHFMDTQTYEQMAVPEEAVAESLKWVLPNEEVEVLYVDESPTDVQVPSAVELGVAETEPGLRGDTASGGGDKPATLESGVVVRVPLFVNVGDRVRVDTRSGEYVSRA